ncbi:hypothetical protein ADIS_2549 [Lunatimonas lonarensis]|uniref:Uncharacterized protein n=1 Tax=Lunatimonas lonarensis TaxID=1232681 RepID=R7ZS90_9BACT|nr:hypothetical protein ADIS_2549 [Lunatimonas lonarensis]
MGIAKINTKGSCIFIIKKFNLAYNFDAKHTVKFLSKKTAKE